MTTDRCSRKEALLGPFSPNYSCPLSRALWKAIITHFSYYSNFICRSGNVGRLLPSIPLDLADGGPSPTNSSPEAEDQTDDLLEARKTSGTGSQNVDA